MELAPQQAREERDVGAELVGYQQIQLIDVAAPGDRVEVGAALLVDEEPEFDVAPPIPDALGERAVGERGIQAGIVPAQRAYPLDQPQLLQHAANLTHVAYGGGQGSCA